MSRQTPTRRVRPTLADDGRQMLESVAEVRALSRRVLEQDADARPLPGRKEPAQRLRDEVKTLGLRRVRSRMHDEPVEAERVGPIELLAERRDRLRAQRGVGRRDVNQIAVVRDDRRDARLARAAAERVALLRRNLARAPLADRLRENLERLAPGGDRPIDRARQAARD